MKTGKCFTSTTETFAEVRIEITADTSVAVWVPFPESTVVCQVSETKSSFPMAIQSITELSFIIEHEEFMDNLPDSSAVSQSS